MRQNALRCLLLSLFALVHARAQDTPKPTGFRAEFLTQLDDVENKIVSLASAIPEEKYSWRPSEGIGELRDSSVSWDQAARWN